MSRAAGWTVYYGAAEDGYPTSQTFGATEWDKVMPFYAAVSLFSAAVMEHTMIAKCEGGNPYTGVKPVEVPL